MNEEQLKRNYKTAILYASDYARFWNEETRNLLHQSERFDDMSLEELRETVRDFKRFANEVSCEVGGLRATVNNALEVEQNKSKEQGITEEEFLKANSTELIKAGKLSINKIHALSYTYRLKINVDGRIHNIDMVASFDVIKKYAKKFSKIELKNESKIRNFAEKNIKGMETEFLKNLSKRDREAILENNQYGMFAMI